MFTNDEKVLPVLDLVATTRFWCFGIAALETGQTDDGRFMI